MSSCATSTDWFEYRRDLLQVRMRRYLYNYQTFVEFGTQVTFHDIKLRCEPCVNAFQQVEESHLVLPNIFWRKRSLDAFGNSLLVAGTCERHLSLAYVSTGIVSLSSYALPVEESIWPIYLYPTNLTLLPSQLEMDCLCMVGNPLIDAMQICHWVHEWVSYIPSSTSMETTASEVFSQRRGVCQDYAHLMIALCRRFGICARYVNGFLMGEGSTHAWVEVSDGHYWFGFDPTNDNQIDYGYIKVAHGRDASDCSVSRGVYRGSTSQSTRISVNVQEF